MRQKTEILNYMPYRMLIQMLKIHVYVCQNSVQIPSKAKDFQKW